MKANDKQIGIIGAIFQYDLHHLALKYKYSKIFFLLATSITISELCYSKAHMEKLH